MISKPIILKLVWLTISIFNIFPSIIYGPILSRAVNTIDSYGLNRIGGIHYCLIVNEFNIFVILSIMLSIFIVIINDLNRKLVLLSLGLGISCIMYVFLSIFITLNFIGDFRLNNN